MLERQAQLLQRWVVDDVSVTHLPIEKQGYIFQQILIALAIQGGMRDKYLT